MPAGRPFGATTKDKPFKEVLRLSLLAAGDERKKLQAIADSLIAKAMEGDVTAIKEIADRLDGKVPQAHIGPDEDGAIHFVIRNIVETREDG